MPEIVGVHPYANEFPMASEEELNELAESVAAVGLIHPVVIARSVAGESDGRLVDGRNRRVACERASVDLLIEERDFDSDDELKEFVIGVNTTGRRESMTVQIAAASTALVLGESKRINGQWKRNHVSRSSSTNEPAVVKALTQCGFILDILGRDALRQVRDSKTSLNACYERALDEKDKAERAAHDEKNAEKEEAEAEAYLKQVGADEILAEVGSKYENHRVARAVWLERNRKEKERLEREKREHQDAIKRDANRIDAFLSGYDGAYSMRTHPCRDEVLQALSPSNRKRFLRIESETTWPTNRI